MWEQDEEIPQKPISNYLRFLHDLEDQNSKY